MSTPRGAGMSGSAPVLVGAGLATAVLAAGLYAFGTEHAPDYSTSLFGQSGADTLSLKSWLATGVLVFAVVQLCLALWMYGKLPGTVIAPPEVGPVHRAIGAAAILLTIPIAYHGAFAAKVVVVQSPRWRVPGWTLPLVGGILVVTVAVLWYTSALWYFNDYKLPSI